MIDEPSPDRLLSHGQLETDGRWQTFSSSYLTMDADRLKLRTAHKKFPSGQHHLTNM